MKQVDKLIVGSFLKSFFGILFIMLFVLLVQIFYSNMHIIIGKHLGMDIYIRLLYYMGVVSLPLAVPLAVLISTVLHFINLSENFELVALKNLGVSFLRILRPLLLAIGGISIGLLFMTNYYIPSSYKNMRNMLFNLGQVNQLNTFREGYFFEDIPGYSIYIGGKDKEKKVFKNVIVYCEGQENMTITGDSALLYNPKKGKKKAIIFQVNDGNSYFEMPPTRLRKKDTFLNDFFRVKFDEQKIFIDSSDFTFSNMFTHDDGSRFSSMNTWKLIKKILAEKRIYDEQKDYIVTQLVKNYGLEPLEKTDENLKYLLDNVENYEDLDEKIAQDKERLADDLERDLRLLGLYKKRFEFYLLEFLSRVLVMLACFLMVILGTCLGTLLSKGEMTIAMVLCAFFGVVYNIGIILFEKMFRADMIGLWLGAGGAILCLIPFAIFLYIHAKNDSQIFKGDFRLFQRLRKKNTSKQS